MSQALNRLVLQPLLAGQIVTVADLFGDELSNPAPYMPSF
jgi:hypothetical protein